MLVRSWAGFVAPACCVCWACSHGVGCLSGSPCAIRVRSRLRCCCGAVVVAVRGCPQGCVVCVVCASNRVRVLLYPDVVILQFVCTSTSALSFVVSLPFEVRERSDERAQRSGGSRSGGRCAPPKGWSLVRALGYLIRSAHRHRPDPSLQNEAKRCDGATCDES